MVEEITWRIKDSQEEEEEEVMVMKKLLDLVNFKILDIYFLTLFKIEDTLDRLERKK